ncbi:MAG: ABC transporter ATP-binding protein [Chloroflexi bacterium]|nr:ABC transporter ATP-binding protein [Chloroflexota bacterium]
MASIELRNLRKTFGKVVAVNDVSLSMADGEFVALLGPSGCGKTTTLRMISGLESPDSGSIHIDGKDVTGLPPRSRDVAMVFQDYALYPHMTILDNIGYPLKVRGVPHSELASQVESVANNLQIGELLARRPGQLSGGQQQRVAVARAVVHRAQVFLFDEPLSNLDAKLRLEARAFLKHLQREVGITAVYVTHDQAEAMALADKIVVMKDGSIMQAGTPLDIYRHPVNTFVASFIGNPPMNLLPCTIDGGKIHIQAGDSPQAVSVDGLHLPKTFAASSQFTLGVRPEHIRILTEPIADAIKGTLYVTQTLGGEALVIVRVGDQLVTVRLFEDEAPPLPHDVYLTFEPDHLFFYGPDGQVMQ